ncbi:A/G-specific adenine glycosylase [Aureimonas mangrovi]|uniref:A/G-specific adenine glycosylase n=1 Tax=Aureimonas mangrovi TaxID=2758041 RepID=UPI00163DABB2|nr:A/G-specific adenine glycosylase [Aureimonas mangrovi]
MRLPSEHAPDARIAGLLLPWYDRHARELPWRLGPERAVEGERADPYRVWLSEIMLQQTTVAAVKSYFARFTERWPSVEALAAAQDGEVMSAWAGLGYYARARNLLACARVVAGERGGLFPTSAEGLRALPGIGDYTSAAIAAIAFGERVAVVDGNVERVTTRLHAIETPLPAGRPFVRHHVDAMTPADRPGDFAQAMMDLGATICTPRKPACVICPIAEPCRARAEGRQETFPVKVKKAAKPSRIGAAFVALRRGDGAVLLRKRPSTGMLGGMSEPPTTAWSARADGATGEDAAPFPADWRLVGEVRHGFTHFDLTLEVWRAVVMEVPDTSGWWAPADALDAEALPTLMRKAIETALAA